MTSKHFFSKEDGQGLVEYALILGLVAVVVIGIMTLFGEQAKGIYCRTTHQLVPDADISSACQAPIAMPRMVDRGSNFINLEVEIYDPDGSKSNPYSAITKVEFYINSTEKNPVHTEYKYRYCLGSNSGTNPCRKYNINSLSNGRHKVIILAYDSDGNVGRSSYTFTK